jgi:hypothetical protein
MGKQQAVSEAIVRRITEAWSSGDAFLVSDDDLSDPAFDVSLSDADKEMEGVDEAFRNDLFRRAGMRSSVVGEDGRRIHARTDLFVCPLVGLDGAVGSMLSSDEDFSFLTRSFREHGLLHLTSAVMLARGAVGPESMAKVGTGALARSVAAMEGAILGEQDGMAVEMVESGVMRELGGLPAHRIREGAGKGATLVLRCLVGARVLVWSEGDDAPVDTACSGFTHGDPELEADWHASVSRRFAPRGIEIQRPSVWSEGVSMGAFMYVRAALEREQDLTGIPFGTEADDQHRFYDEKKGVLSVSMRFGSDIVGPVSVPVALVSREPSLFMDSLSSMAPRIVQHGSLESLTTCRVRPPETSI